MSSLLLLSGGIDSTAIAAWLRPTLCLTVDYGQCSAPAELTAAAQICKELGLPHLSERVNVAMLGAGDMAGTDPSRHSENSEFWPYRNQFLITVAAMAAIKYGCDLVMIGTVITDKLHIDGSAQFLSAMDGLLALQEGGLHLSAPASELTSVELVRASQILPGIIGWCHSCHKGRFACGQCGGCKKHSKVMQALGWVR